MSESSSLPAEAPREIPEPECGQMWMQDCTARDWGHVCILPEKHTIDHLCVCKARIGCVCMCHDPEPTITSHVRPCCIDWVGGFWGKVGEAYPLIEARIRRDMAAHIREVAADSDWGHVNLRKFIQRHDRLHTGDSVVAVMLALADEIAEPGRETYPKETGHDAR